MNSSIIEGGHPLGE